MIIRLKYKNYKAVRSFADGTSNGMEGDKLMALYRLIQKKGDPIKTDERNLDGIKALEFGLGEYIAIKKTSFSKPAGLLNNKPFFPCMIQTFFLTNI